MMCETAPNAKQLCGRVCKITGNGLNIAEFDQVEHHNIIKISSNRIV